MRPRALVAALHDATLVPPVRGRSDVVDGFDLDRAQARALRRWAQRHIRDLQEGLYAEGTRSLLVVLQGLDTAGKDGTLRRVFRLASQQGVRVASFKVPTPLEARHDFLWRIHQHTPVAGEIAVFNRSHYEDLIVPSANGALVPEQLDERVRAIEAFERHLVASGTSVVKLFLDVSYQVQGERLLERLEQPSKHWKFSEGDLATRERFDRFRAAYDLVLERTSFDIAPWHRIPADRRWYRNAVASAVVVQVLLALDPHPPVVEIEHLKRIEQQLRAELASGDGARA